MVLILKGTLDANHLLIGVQVVAFDFYTVLEAFNKHFLYGVWIKVAALSGEDWLANLPGEARV